MKDGDLAEMSRFETRELGQALFIILGDEKMCRKDWSVLTIIIALWIG